jgi:chemotaxis protein methyltransferase CheR
MDSRAFNQLRSLAYDKAGIDIGANKETLVAARVAKRLRALGLEDERGYAELITADETGQELIEFLDAISTNFTSFFREADHFGVLKDLVRSKVAAGQKRLRLWSAACSSGEEPYTMAITLAEAIADPSVDWRILASDISTRVLAAAAEGAYSEQQVATVPSHLRSRYLQHRHGATGDEAVYRVTESLKQHISFRRVNLSGGRLPMKGPLDVVFCRNVMIYFDTAVRQKLISGIEELLCPGGLLFISHTETLTGVKSSLVLEQPSVYRKPDVSP